MASGSLTRRVLFGGMGMRSMGGDIGATVLRVFAGLAMALAHGWGKIPAPDWLVDDAANMGFPAPAVFAWAAAISEFFGGLLLAAGLLTRWAALMILLTMLSAAFLMHVPRGDEFGDYEKALLFAAIALMFLFAGSGRLSVDSMLR